MCVKNLILSVLILSSFSVKASANLLDELDPRDPNVNETLSLLDMEYEAATGESAFVETGLELFGGCYQRSCGLFLDVDKSTQKAQLFMDGALVQEWPVSTGVKGHSTPNFDRHPNGRIYKKYSSTKYPGGDYMGLGNMPYAVFISGGFAIHGTGKGNWKKLGSRASHGCIRLHPDNAKLFNELVTQYGIYETWITVR